jgi:hypothetical protein
MAPAIVSINLGRITGYMTGNMSEISTWYEENPRDRADKIYPEVLICNVLALTTRAVVSHEKNPRMRIRIQMLGLRKAEMRIIAGIFGIVRTMSVTLIRRSSVHPLIYPLMRPIEVPIRMETPPAHNPIRSEIRAA